MAKGILGRKVGMTQIFGENGEIIPVTVIDTTSNVLLQKKTVDTDGYEAAQIGFEDKREKVSNKPEIGHAAKASTAPKRFIKEFKVQEGLENELMNFEIGQEIKCDIFAEGEIVDVTGTSKGKGYQGAIKRHGQSRGPMAHGSRYHRRPGSMGPIKGNMKGKNLPGQTGNEQVTIQNLKVVKVDTENNVILIRGSIPGPNKSCVMVKTAVKSK